jgi:hypothetical protein
MSASRNVLAAAALSLASGCTAENGLGPTPIPHQRGPVPAAIGLVSGNNQPAKAGERLAEPLVVRVTDFAGDAISGVIVDFRVTFGAGAFGDRCDGPNPAATATAATNSSGIAEVAFEPTVLGRSVVTAQIPGSRDAGVTFVFDASVLVIEFWAGIWNVGFIGPCPYSSDVTVPVGTTVEWGVPVEDERYPITYTVTSTSTPPRAAGFDSGSLTHRDRFRFVPAVTGTWAYRDRFTGLTGTLTAK